jgi:site-specific DNA recombinase
VPTCDIYLRLSDARVEQALEGREAKLRAFAAALGWIVFRVVIENDMIKGKDGKLRPRPASAFKRVRVRDRDGQVVRDPDTGEPVTRVVRPGWQSVISDLKTRRVNAILAEDLDRVVRDPRDLEDLIDACERTRASARSISGSLTLTDGGTDSEITMARNMVAYANKSSRDTARRVREKREALNGLSYQGGPRPFGFVHAQDTEKYHRTLIMVPDEAEILRQAADDILNRGISLNAISRDFRQRGVPTAKGDTEWSSVSLKKVLLKPAVAGLSVHTAKVRDEATGEIRAVPTLKPAPWEPILDRDVWERLTEKLKDPSRLTTPVGTGNEPRYLLSNIAVCGACTGEVKVTGSASGWPTYMCRDGFHVRRKVALVDEFIERLIIARLSQPDAADLLRPPVRQGIDTAGLRAEAKRLRAAKAGQMRLHASGAIDDDDLALGMKEIKDRLDVVNAQLAASDEPDPLAEFRDRPAAAVWESLSLPRKRAVVRLLAEVTIMPTTRRGKGFDPDSVSVTWNT